MVDHITHFSYWYRHEIDQALLLCMDNESSARIHRSVLTPLYDGAHSFMLKAETSDRWTDRLVNDIFGKDRRMDRLINAHKKQYTVIIAPLEDVEPRRVLNNTTLPF